MSPRSLTSQVLCLHCRNNCLRSRLILLFVAVVEVGVYILSDHLLFRRGMVSLIEVIPWPTLRHILSIQAPSIQALTESVFLHAIEIDRLQVASDLLRLE
jgi:hypothetical protein